jgi:hypothetical protein
MPYLRKGKGREANIIEGKNRVKEIGESECSYQDHKRQFK